MKNKIKINEDNYKEVVLKRAIIICWILLLACFAIKIFGGNYFAVACTNEKFVRVCEFIDNSIVKYVIYVFQFTLTNYLLITIVDGGFKIKSLKSLLYLIVSLVIWTVKLLLELDIIQVSLVVRDVFEFIVLYLLLLAFSKKYIKSLFCVMILFVFLLISAFVKSIGMQTVITEYFLLAQIFAIDCYIMLLITALHSKLKFSRRRE